MLVAEARVRAVTHLLRRGSPLCFTGESALVALGLEPWWNNPDVMLRRERPVGTHPTLNSVRLGKHTVSAVLARETRSSPGDAAMTRASGLPIAPPQLIAADLGRMLHPLQAFHDCSVLLRHLSGFDRFSLAESRARERIWRDVLLEFLGRIGRSRGVRRARAVVMAADAGLESPGESAVSWLLNCVLADTRQLSSQHPVQAAGTTVFIDLAIPDHQVAVEVTGRGKFGASSDSAHEVAERFVSRQQALTDSGWRFLNITYDQALRPLTLASYLLSSLGRYGVPVREPSGPLWELPSPMLFDRSRRF